MTFCPDDQTNPSLCVVVVRENFFRIRRDKKAFKVLGQNEKKKKLSHNARHLIRILLVILRIRRSIRGVRGVDGYGSGNVVIRDA